MSNACKPTSLVKTYLRSIQSSLMYRQAGLSGGTPFSQPTSLISTYVQHVSTSRFTRLHTFHSTYLIKTYLRSIQSSPVYPHDGLSGGTPFSQSISCSEDTVKLSLDPRNIPTLWKTTRRNKFVCMGICTFLAQICII